MAKYLTKESLEKFKKELEYLEKTKRKEIADKLKQAISFGDLSENAAYTEAKEEQAFLEGKILELKRFVFEAKIISKKETSQVQIGSTVFVKLGDNKEKFLIVEPEEADILSGKISYFSPVGKSLLGKRKGDIVKIETPEGKTEYKIIEIE